MKNQEKEKKSRIQEIKNSRDQTSKKSRFRELKKSRTQEVINPIPYGLRLPPIPYGGGAILPPPCLKSTEMVKKGWGLV